MERCRELMHTWHREWIAEIQKRVDEARVDLAYAEADLADATEALPFALVKIDRFLESLRPATAMPERGEVFFNLAIDADRLEQRCMVVNPAFGFGIRFTVEGTGPDRIWNDGTTSAEYKEGDLLEYLGVGATPVKPGDRITLTRDHMFRDTILRHSVEFYEENSVHDSDRRLIDNGRGRIARLDKPCRFRYSDDWPPVAGVVVSVEPRCRAYIGLPPNVRTIEEVAESGYGTERYFTLRQVFVPWSSELKAAAKKK